MRPALPIALALLAAGSPALATGTIHCRGAIRPDLEIYLVIGRGAGAVISQARLIDGSNEFATGATPTSPVIAQSWLDERDLRLDIADSNFETRIARLEGRSPGGTRPYVGTLRYRGRAYAMTCRSED